MRLRLAVYGTVQGVGFRYFVRQAARAADVAGYVRNRDDGAVELEAEASDSALAHLRHTVQHGPPGSIVLRIEELPVTDEPLPLPFTIRR